VVGQERAALVGRIALRLGDLGIGGGSGVEPGTTTGHMATPTRCFNQSRSGIAPPCDHRAFGDQIGIQHSR